MAIHLLFTRSRLTALYTVHVEEHAQLLFGYVNFPSAIYQTDVQIGSWQDALKTTHKKDNDYIPSVLTSLVAFVLRHAHRVIHVLRHAHTRCLIGHV